MPSHHQPAHGYSNRQYGQRPPMSRTARVLWIFAGAVGVTAFCTLSALAYVAHAVATSPMIQVHVAEKTSHGTNFHLAVPASLVAAGIRVAPWVMPEDEMEDMRREIEAGLSEVPVDARRLAAELVEDLKAMPDATLVEVDDGHDHVVVAKRGDEIRIRVESPEADVDVILPLSLVDEALAFIDV